MEAAHLVRRRLMSSSGDGDFRVEAVVSSMVRSSQIWDVILKVELPCLGGEL